jgi:hypothetical protein
MITTEPDGTQTRRRARWARALVIVAAALAAWSLLVAITGGIRYDIGPLRVSSRNPVRPALFAPLCIALAWRLARWDWRQLRAGRVGHAARFVEPAIVWGAAACLLTLGLLYGVRAAGGSDALGYVSESARWLRGTLRIDQSVASRWPWPHAADTLAPLGYRPVVGASWSPRIHPVFRC